MLKRIVIIVGLLIVGFASFILLYKPLENDPAVARKPSFTKEEKRTHALLDSITEQINAKYEGLKYSVGTTSKKTVDIQLVEDEAYFNSIKEDIESIVKNVIKSSVFKDYTVIVMRLDLSFMKEEHKQINDELLRVTKTLNESLKADYGVFKNITTSSEKSITIYTSIKGTGKESQKLALEIEESIHDILQSEELKSIPQMDSYKIEILNSKGKVVN